MTKKQKRSSRKWGEARGQTASSMVNQLRIRSTERSYRRLQRKRGVRNPKVQAIRPMTRGTPKVTSKFNVGSQIKTMLRRNTGRGA